MWKLQLVANTPAPDTNEMHLYDFHVCDRVKGTVHACSTTKFNHNQFQFKYMKPENSMQLIYNKFQVQCLKISDGFFLLFLVCFLLCIANAVSLMYLQFPLKILIWIRLIHCKIAKDTVHDIMIHHNWTQKAMFKQLIKEKINKSVYCLSIHT
jgi:hypothetical protein